MGKLTLQNLLAYMEAMHPTRPMSAQEGARHQVGLYRALMTAINQLDADFQLVFGTMLQLLIHGADSVFHDSNAYRFTETIQLPESDRKTFVTLLTFLKNMAEPAGRAVVAAQTDLNRVLGQGITDQGRQRVLAFFNL